MRFLSWDVWREGRSLWGEFSWILGITGAIAIMGFFPLKTPAQSLLEDCNQFVETVNQNEALLDTFGSEIAAFSETIDQAKTLADIQTAAQQYVSAVGNVTTGLGELASEIADLPLVDAELSDYRSQYVGILGGFQDALNQIASAMELVAGASTEQDLLNNLEKLEQDTDLAVRDIDQIAIAESELIDAINRHCGAVF